MSSLRQIVCLANSWKHKERCIAGIDLKTGKWVRPVCDQRYPEDGRVSESVRLIKGKEPQLLDILEIPLDHTGNNFGFESENLSVLPGKWRSIGRYLPADLIQFCSREPWILHNTEKNVLPSYLQSLPHEQRQTLQLWRSKQFRVTHKGQTWKGNIGIANGECIENLTITDPMLVSQLEAGYKPPQTCFITVSLSMPWGYEDWEGEKPCWKLIAGVIPDLFSLIGVQMQKLGWCAEQGSQEVGKQFGCGKKSLRQLTLEELQQFLDHLRSLSKV